MENGSKEANPNKRLTVLQVDASGRYDGSNTRALAGDLIARIDETDGVDRVIERDVAKGVEFVDQDWIGATFTAEEERTETQKQRLAGSDELVNELFDADVLVIATPIYNFGPPAALKAWIDQVARARKTFAYTETGPVGLVHGKKAYLVITSGGVAVDSDYDFTTGYLRHFLGFIGITDVTVIAADRLNVDADGQMTRARQSIAAIPATLAA